MNKFRIDLFLFASVAALVLVAVPGEEKKPPPPPTKTDVARVIRASAQTIPQRLKRSPHDARRLACQAYGKTSDKARTRTACHNYPYLALGRHILPIA